ncbi:hypothetical protein EFA46_003080 [Halarchaeum sp. CBA1220]|uniref:DUF7857 domain-containing protein n=1 Tax=Halarchaeum sp. CBA1220 TaxID=1853682 RepID=UPI000F3A80BE|nr:hypothetical protein [Halarchaeum sp. CBA1220]QLC33232.1 hypothetical protein EFA46_003080 [Halarchaeum sp. CBA1220]
MALTLSSRATEHDGVTLVRAVLRNDGDAPRGVRVANALKAPVLAPRPGGVVADGWDDDGYEGVVDAGESRALGYACRAAPREDPCVIERDERARETGRRRRVADAVRDLGDPRPPAAGVPTAEQPNTSDAGAEIPRAVAAWLDGVEARTAAGTATPEDDRTLAALGARVAALREDA